MIQEKCALVHFMSRVLVFKSKSGRKSMHGLELPWCNGLTGIKVDFKNYTKLQVQQPFSESKWYHLNNSVQHPAITCWAQLVHAKIPWQLTTYQQHQGSILGSQHNPNQTIQHNTSVSILTWLNIRQYMPNRASLFCITHSLLHIKRPISSCCKFPIVCMCQNYENWSAVDKVIAII